MPEIGQNLAHYKIVEKIGKGGMGEVFRAKDQKLGRDVAIKVLPEEFARDVDRVARFQREAKLLASLNHPNIAAIYGLEESGGTNFLVLELVEGQTLADRIKAGPVPVEESLKLALQIAEALEAAHEKGVIHRDLKPANIKVTPDGKVKVLDFGLAKAYAGDREEVNLSNSPTLSDAATQQGVILGTAAYMSPEQARGKTVDKRADIWAFGAVLFEMLTGEVAFQGEDVTEILAAVVKGSANLDLLPANLHPRVREVVVRCLQKDLKRRYSSITDARYEIEQALADPSGVFVPQIPAAKPRKRPRVGLMWVASALVLGAIIAGVAVWKLKPPEPRQVTRFSYELPKDQQFGDFLEPALAVSPDGRQFVYAANEGLYLHSMDEMDAKLLPGTGGSRQRPFFSPDGKWIGFFSNSDGKLKKIAISGGAPVILADVRVSGSFYWNLDDTILYGQARRGLMRVSANGGASEVIIKAENGTIRHPQILPDSDSVLFELSTPAASRKITVQSRRSGERKELLDGITPKYLPTGHIVYGLESNLFAVPFNPKTLNTAGGSVNIVQDVLRAGGAPQYAVSDSGTLVYIPGTVVGEAGSGNTLVWVTRDGKEEPQKAEPHSYSAARISPDGTKVALQFETDGNMDIWVWDLAHQTMTRLTFDPTGDLYPLWTRDGKRIVFVSNREGTYKIYIKAADGTGKDEALSSTASGAPISQSSDGKTIILNWGTATTGADISALSLEGDRKYRPLLSEKYNEFEPQISPNGRWLAYASDESGRAQIYVRPFPEVDGGRWQISTAGGNSPLWSPDGRELFYSGGDAVMVVSVKTEPTFSHETPKVLFRGTYLFPALNAASQISTVYNPWDISPDGKRFLMIKPPGTTAGGGGPRKINVVVNWFEELKQRVPIK